MLMTSRDLDDLKVHLLQKRAANRGGVTLIGEKMRVVVSPAGVKGYTTARDVMEGLYGVGFHSYLEKRRT